MSQKHFQEALVFSLTGNEPENTRLGKSPGDMSGKGSSYKLIEKDGLKKDTRKRCHGCYEKISLFEGFKVARNKATTVNRFCFECKDKPHICITCLGEKNSA